MTEYEFPLSTARTLVERVDTLPANALVHRWVLRDVEIAARAVQAAAGKYGQRLRYHLKIDTGMNRLGFRFDNLRRSLPELLASANLELAAVYTHFATADDPASPLFNEQRVRFERALTDVQPPSLRAVTSVPPR